MSLKLAVKKTIEYAGNFQSHINVDEVKKRLISKNIYPERTVDRELQKINWKNKKNKWKKDKLIKARELALKIESKFVDVLFLGISGSVASDHPKQNDDIDLLVITKVNSLWKNRLIIRWWIYQNNIPHRKYNDEENGDQFCFNLWLDENNLLIPQDKQNLQNAMDLILLKPLINKNNTYEKFLITNVWAKRYVATGYSEKVSSIINLVFNPKKESFLKKISNWIYFWPQYWYMKPKMDREKISLHQAFFHKQMIK